MSGQAEAGWYPDPSGAPRQRYFDGNQWTEHYHDAAVVQPAQTSPQDTIISAQPPAYAASAQPAYDAGGLGPGVARTPGLTSAGTLFSAAWTGVKAKIGPLLGILVGYIVASVVLVVVLYAVLLTQIDNIDSFDDLGDFLGIAIVLYLIYALVSWALVSIWVLMSSRLMQLYYRGHNASIDGAWSKTKTRLGGFYGTSIVLYVGFLIANVVLLFILGAIVNSPAILVVFVPIYLFAWVKLGFLPIAAVATNRGDSMVSASTGVSGSGRFWPVLGRMLLLSLPFLVSYLVGIGLASTGSGGAAALGFLIILVGAALGSLILAAGLTKLYLESGAPSDI